MSHTKPYQTILVSSIVLVIVFICTLLYSLMTSHQHTKHIDQMNSIFLAQSKLEELTSTFEQYYETLEKDLQIKPKPPQEKWLELHQEFDSQLEYLQKNINDQEISIYFNELKLLSERLTRFEAATLTAGFTSTNELMVYHKKFQALRVHIASLIMERYKYNRDANSHLLRQGRIASIFIVVFGAAVALSLAVSVFMALKQTVSRNYVQTLMQTVGIALVVVDEQGKITFVNDKMKNYFGVDPSKQDDLLITSLVEPKLYEEYIKPNRSFELETQLYSSSEGWIPIFASGTILKDEANNYYGFILSAQDLRSSKALQKQLAHAEKMVSLGTIAAGVAHEINNPTSFIQSNLTTLKDYFAGMKDVISSYENLATLARQSELKTLNQELQTLEQKKSQYDLSFVLQDVDQALGDSLEGIERIKEIVQGLRSFSRNDESVLGFVDLNEVLEGTLKLIWNELKYKCEVVKDFSELPSLRCYPRQISQVFMNLLLNAAQAIVNHGRITIKTETTSEAILITVTDTGKGMPKDITDKIFDPFFTTKAVGAGTGLGLSISYGIIKKHGGTIDVQSVEGQGTSFSIRLPLSGGLNG